jgi:hypothetical protein
MAPEYAELANDTLSHLPNEVPVIRIETAQAWPFGVLELLVGSMQLVGQVSDAAGLDPARPCVPAFGRALYRMSSQGKIAGVAPDPIARQLIALGTPASTEIRDHYQGELERWTTMLSELQFDGLVLAYDGTVCTTEKRFDPPDMAIVELLVSAVERGVCLGLASGRGSSLHRELRNVMPESLWSRVYAGMYNGALVPLGNVTVVTSVHGSKVLSVGALLAAYDKDLTVVSAGPTGYRIQPGAEIDKVIAGSQLVCLWLDGEPYR